MTEGDVHLWYGRLDHSPTRCSRWEKWLSPDERARADRFLRNIHRSRFVACRALLRELLGAYTGLSPDAIVFTYNAYGKPGLRIDFAGSGEQPLEFNVSHCEGIALFAVARGCPVGVDLQTVSAEQAIPTQYFTAAERAIADAAPVSERARVGARLWARKEAYLKAVGRGFHGKGNDAPALSHWEVHDWDWNAGDCSGVAALCTEGAGRTVHDRGWWTGGDDIRRSSKSRPMFG